MSNKVQTIVLKVSDNIIKEMDKFYNGKKRLINPPYSLFQAQEADTVITAYTSGKVVFQGISADVDANIWRDITKHQEKVDPLVEKKDKETKEDSIKLPLIISSIGSDEVGTGDYFGPIVVTATFVSKENANWVNNLGVKDSKKMTDETILKIVPDLIKKIPYISYVFSPKEYNEKYSKDLNMNRIKAILHNKVLTDIQKKGIIDYDYIVVDQFVYPKKYYEHLNGAIEITKNITFLTKAESKCLSVAAASVISRYIFLKEMDKLSNYLGMNIPKGASPLVDNAGKEIVKKYGKEKLKEVAKLNFKNTDKILN